MFYDERCKLLLRTDDRPTIDLASWKISSGHNSTIGHANHFVFGSRLGFWLSRLNGCGWGFRYRRIMCEEYRMMITRAVATRRFI